MSGSTGGGAGRDAPSGRRAVCAMRRAPGANALEVLRVCSALLMDSASSFAPVAWSMRSARCCCTSLMPSSPNVPGLCAPYCRARNISTSPMLMIGSEEERVCEG